MNTLTNIFDLETEYDRKKLKNLILNAIPIEDNNLNEYMPQKQLHTKVFCPHCKTNQIKKNGHKGIVQRYMCLTCKKTFTLKTNTIISSIKKDLSVWEKFIDCMVKGYSIRKSAEICNINKDTSFIWKHKILDALQNITEENVDNNKTFVQMSYKRNCNVEKA